MDITIDLEDGLPPSRQETHERKAKARESTPVRFAAPTDKIEITVTPIALVISVAPVRCLGCGAEHRDHRGIFVENKLSNGVISMRRTDLRGVSTLFANLPRRVDVAPAETIPVCYDCWMIERTFRDAVNVAQAEAVSFGEPGQAKEVASIAAELAVLHSEGEQQ